MANNGRIQRNVLYLSPAQFVAMIVFVLLVLLIASLVSATNDSYNLNRVYQSEERQLAALRAEGEQLKKQRDRLQTDDEIQRLVREKLGYLMPGEVAIVPQQVDKLPTQSSVTIDAVPSAPLPLPAPKPVKPTYLQWLDLFLYP